MGLPKLLVRLSILLLGLTILLRRLSVLLLGLAGLLLRLSVLLQRLPELLRRLSVLLLPLLRLSILLRLTVLGAKLLLGLNILLLLLAIRLLLGLPVLLGLVRIESVNSYLLLTETRVLWRVHARSHDWRIAGVLYWFRAVLLIRVALGVANALAMHIVKGTLCGLSVPV